LIDIKAIVTKTFGNRPEMVVEERPKPMSRDGFSLVRMHSATINQLSNTIRMGGHGAARAPLVLGNEGSGTVEESRRFTPGTHVAVYGGGELGITQDGLFQEWALVEDRRLIELPETLDLDEGSALTVNYLTAYRALTHVARLDRGQTVLVSGGTGSVGHALVQVAKALGGRPVALVSSAEKARRAREAGTPSVIDLSSQQNVGDVVRDLTGGQGADLAFDPVGGPMLNQLLRSVRPRGTVVAIGFTGGKEPAFDVVDMIVHEKRIVGYSLHAETDEDVSAALADLGALAAGGHLKPVIDSTVSIEEFEKGYGRLASRQAVGSVVLRL
jgi:NADPH2:quinone reductase